MTHQFKFGDIVRIKETGYTGSVIDFKFGVVVASHGDTSIDTFDSDELELIPHPDTVRLDWLAKTNLMPVDEWIFEDEDGNEYEKAVVVRPDLNYFDEVLVTADDIRQAIDTAMRQEAV